MEKNERVLVENRNGSAIITGIDEKPIKIPSQMYPLSGQLCYINTHNTTPFPADETTERIRRVYNSVETSVGTCYSNIDRLVQALAQEGIKATPFVGWVCVAGATPVHHCFAVIDDHILDFTLRPDLFATDEFVKETDIDKLREQFSNLMIELDASPRDQVTTFGQASQYSVYFASPCKPAVGVKQFQKLMRAFPKHPSYQNVQENGMSQTQKLYYEKTGRNPLRKNFPEK